MVKKIVLITAGQPSLNPRIVKEASALLDAGYEVTLIYQYWNKWATKLDLSIFADKRLAHSCVGGNPDNQKVNYLMTRARHRLARKIAEITGLKNAFSEMALGRCTPELINKAKLIKADLYIAHNLAALPAAVEAAKKNKAKCGFDAEDFHRFEVSNDPLAFDVKLKVYIENKYFNQLDYLTTASPFISEAYKKLYPNLAPLTVLNVFPKHQLKIKQEQPTLKLFWFSQFIGVGRGLEIIIKAICRLKTLAIELHLLGKYDSNICKTLDSLVVASGINKKVIFYHEPISPDAIYDFASQFDIGLATEISFPKNRDICLTNKIFTYLQAGLAVIASDTTAQEWLLHTYQGFGHLFKKDDDEGLSEILKLYFKDRELLQQHKKRAHNLGLNDLNWEVEQLKFLKLVSNQFVK